MRYDDPINAQLGIQLFQQIEQHHPQQLIFILFMTMCVIIDPN
ncbi:hypothetical protein [Nitrosomonas sp. Nm34]|nr:hypothetical protein [Nitrosomonas sp. Nm34]